MATNISHWLKVQSRWFKNYQCYIAFIIPLHTYYCAIFYSLDAGFFNTIQVSKSLDPDQAPHFVEPDLGPLFAEIISRQQKALLAGKELNTKQLIETTFWLKPWLELISFTSNYFHLANVLATTNSERGYVTKYHELVHIFHQKKQWYNLQRPS